MQERQKQKVNINILMFELCVDFKLNVWVSFKQIY